MIDNILISTIIIPIVIGLLSSVVGGLLVAWHISSVQATRLCHNLSQDFYEEVERILALLRRKNQLGLYKEYVKSSKRAKKLYTRLLRLLVVCYCPKYRRMINNFWNNKIWPLTDEQKAIPVWGFSIGADLVAYSDENSKIYTKLGKWLQCHWFIRWLHYCFFKLSHRGWFANIKTKTLADFMKDFRPFATINNPKGKMVGRTYNEDWILRGQSGTTQKVPKTKGCPIRLVMKRLLVALYLFLEDISRISPDR